MFEPKIRINIFKDSLWELKTIVNFVLEIGTGKSEYIINDYSIKNSFPILGSTSIIGFDNSFDYSGDFILTARVGANAGEIYKYSGEAKITDNTVYIKSNCLDYLYYSLLHYNLKRLSFGTGQPLIKTSELKKIKIFFPSSLEQTAIGTLFRTLDDLLASYKDNLANYQSLKATMLSKMFPKAGQTVPEIRLDGYKGEWDLIKLGDFCDLITKGTTGKSQSEQGKVNFVKVENLKDNEIYPIVKISEEEHFGSLKRSILYEGDILFSIAGTLGRTAIVKNNILPANTNQALAIIRGYKLDAYFLLVVLSGEVVKDYIRKNPTVGAQPNLSLEQVSSLKIKIPSLEEQQAIGAYFSNLDNLINSYQDKISQLETLKKKLLQDMFI
ncbi:MULTISPECIES: restriction endonuclease subunit S [unclassified Streptococcus]|uniref:restriction endonuclease subunit S n=1 Tax=unclassified Streptococcus TaxID=2608887 RepID=UPI0019129CB6|nr:MULTISPECIES: restriction endonuclease subunit S [unclassified Streptococcus]MBK5024306.1 restriction endonuclease subunit S [Streptococcus sp. 17.1]MBK5158248.1 restriction endonuclease subunit S [Streptococcus sp. 23.2]MDU3422142.1 restriction endonuclease subunit S [Streptococcus sp.]